MFRNNLNRLGCHWEISDLTTQSDSIAFKAQASDISAARACFQPPPEQSNAQVSESILRSLTFLVSYIKQPFA